jgi:hypothetical protein
MVDLNDAKLPSALADIRETEQPGRRGGAFCYARAVYACFTEIQGLVSEGFTLATICRFLEKKGVLPVGADTRGFCGAYRRENSRRERSARPKKTKAKEVKNDGAAKLNGTTGTEREPDTPAKQTIPPVKPRGGVLVNPDNTFEIRLINRDLLPAFEDLTKRRNGE